MSRALRRPIVAPGLTVGILLPASASAQARRAMALQDLLTAPPRPFIEGPKCDDSPRFLSNDRVVS